MDEKTAKAILANLLDRVAQGSTASMTPEMIDAVRLASRKAFGEGFATHTDEAREGDADNEATQETPKPAIVQESIVIHSRSLELVSPEEPEVTLCLDFGTAMSKAFAIRSQGNVLTPIDLALGKIGGERTKVYPVSSSIWISDDGLIFFGREAIRRSLLHGKRPRLDSLKQYLSQGDVPLLMHQLVERDCNPSGIKLTIEDALTLYISYLTDIACSALEDRKVSRYVRRRFALPPWPADRRNDCDKSLRDLLARGQVIADHFHGKWANGISAKTAKQVIEQVRILPNLPVHLIDRGVSEPLAAAQGRLGFNDEDELVRGLAVVIDVGAGTSDFGLFHVNRRVGSDEEVIAIPICQRNLRQAGDFVDECLRRFILKSTRISDSAPDFKLINDHLALNIRDFKERLFLNRSLTDVLSNSMPINITLDQFLAEPDVKDFGERMCHEFDELLNEKETLEWVRARSSAGLLIVFTGGGADLPMVQRLAHHKCHPHAIAIQNRPAARTSQFIEKNYPALVPEYPQLAVAIGGAHPDLPEEAWGGGPRSDPGIVANKSWAG